MLKLEEPELNKGFLITPAQKQASREDELYPLL